MSNFSRTLLCLMMLFACTTLRGEETIESIDLQLKDLQTELQKSRKDNFNKEMNAQPLMFDNWDEYTQDIGDTEKDEKNILEIKKKIQMLNERKKILQNEHPSTK